MAVTLVASTRDIKFLHDIALGLQQEDVEIRPEVLDSNFSRVNIDSPELILISRNQELDRIGEIISHLRKAVGQECRIILCVRQTVATKRRDFVSLGASEVISPASTEVQEFAERILAHLILEKKIEPYNCGKLYGGTKCMRDLYAEIKRLAPLEVPVLILGELGTGKELVARELHDQSGRRGTYKVINCPEFTDDLFSVELFGHTKGAFTGAEGARKGLIAGAEKATAFFDEIGDLSPASQPKLLRLLQENTFRHIGSDDEQKSKARIVLATNQNLFENAEGGRRKISERSPVAHERIRS